MNDNSSAMYNVVCGIVLEYSTSGDVMMIHYDQQNLQCVCPMWYAAVLAMGALAQMGQCQ